MNEGRELVRFVHIALAITAPVLVIGRLLLDGASEAAQQGFAYLGVFLCFVIVFALDGRRKRSRRRDQ